MVKKRPDDVPLPAPHRNTSPLPYLSLLACGDNKFKVVSALIRNGVLVEHEILTEALESGIAAVQLRRFMGQLVFRPATRGP